MKRKHSIIRLIQVFFSLSKKKCSKNVSLSTKKRSRNVTFLSMKIQVEKFHEKRSSMYIPNPLYNRQDVTQGQFLTDWFDFKAHQPL